MVELMTKEKNNALSETKIQFLEEMTERGAISEKTAESYGRILGMVKKERRRI